MRRIAFAVAILLAACSSTDAPAPAIRPEPVAAAPDPCAKYAEPTTHARCQLYTGADAGRFIPEVGRAADLDTQLRCAPLRLSPEPYASCVSKSAATRIVALPRVVSPAPRVEQPQPVPTVARTVLEPQEQPTAAIARPVEQPAPPATIERTVKRPAPAVGRATDATHTAVAPPAVRSWPYCAENGSCYDDISSYTRRPKTVHVTGYYRKDGTYVRGHYRSRPRR